MVIEGLDWGFFLPGEKAGSLLFFWGFLAFLTLFTVLPGINKYAHKFDFSVKVGPQGEYVEKKHIVLNYEEVVSLIPLYALFIPSQDGSFCRGSIIRISF